MITAQDIRIGNYINNGIDEVFQVNPQTIGNWDIGNATLGGFSPISLTEEWLIKFGLTERRGARKGVYYKGEFEIDIHMMHIYFGYNRILNKTAENYYVHQLQNLYFALTDKELTLSK